MPRANHQMARYSDAVSPLTDLAVVYGTEGFQMGFGFATIAMPQVKAGARERSDLNCWKCFLAQLEDQLWGR